MINNKETIAIIGAGPGTGYAVAERFGKEGFNVALIARNAGKLKTLTTKLEKECITANILPQMFLISKPWKKDFRILKAISVH